jgi:cation transport ATPase
METLPGFMEGEVLRLAADLEQASEIPLAVAIVAHTQDQATKKNCLPARISKANGKGRASMGEWKNKRAGPHSALGVAGQQTKKFGHEGRGAQAELRYSDVHRSRWQSRSLVGCCRSPQGHL